MYNKFVNEAGVDEGDVQRDMLTAFWDKSYFTIIQRSN